MRQISFVILATALFGASALQAEVASPQAQYTAESKTALDRYRADLKQCDEDSTSGARLQCRRDAKQEYDRVIGEAKARRDVALNSQPGGGSATPKAAAPPACADCGVVMEVGTTEKAGEGSAAGLIAGGIGGALLGRQIGSGSGRDVATIAGAAGGAYAGKKIEEKIKTHKVWTVAVQYTGGSRRTFEFTADPGFKVGDRVRNSDKTIVRE